MLDAFYIFTKGGLILFSFSLAALKGNPVEALIRTCLLEERTADAAFNYTFDNASYCLKWSIHNELGLVFVAVRISSRNLMLHAHCLFFDRARTPT